jgi:hypothetical protein
MDTMTLTSPGDPTSPSAAHAAPGPQADGARAARSSGQRPPRSGWLHRMWRGAETDPAWARPALLGVLLATLVLYT